MQPRLSVVASQQRIGSIAAERDELGQRVGPQALGRGHADMSAAIETAGREGAIGERRERPHAACMLIAQ